MIIPASLFSQRSCQSMNENVVQTVDFNPRQWMKWMYLAKSCGKGKLDIKASVESTTLLHPDSHSSPWLTVLVSSWLPPRVVSGSRDATLRVWDIETGQCLHVLMGHVAAVRCVQYDGRRVVSGAYDFMVKVWDPETETCLHTLQGHTNRVYSLQVSIFRHPLTWVCV